MNGQTLELGEQPLQSLTGVSRETKERQLALRLALAHHRWPEGIPAGERKRICTWAGISKETFYRRQRALFGREVEPGRKRVRKGTLVITEPMHEHFAPHLAPKLKDVHKRLKEHFPDDPIGGYANFTKVVKNYVDTDWFQKIRGGVYGGLHAQTEILDLPVRCGRRWNMDVKNLGAPVTEDGKYDPRDLWIISVWDDGSRDWLAKTEVLGVVVAEHILATIAQAARVAGGIAEWILCDNAGENLSALVTDWVEGAGSRIVMTNSGHSNENGKAEAPHRMMRNFACTLPGFTGGPIDLNGSIPLPAEGDCVTASFVRNKLAALREQYNNTSHSTLGMSPDAAWAAADAADELDLIEIDPAWLAVAAMPDPYPRGTPKGSKVIGDVGVELTINGVTRTYWCEYFQGKTHIRGKQERRVKLRYWPGDLSRVEVFNLNNEWRGTAVIKPTAEQRRGNNARNAAINANVRAHQSVENSEAIVSNATVKAPRTDGKVQTQKRAKRTGEHAIVVAQAHADEHAGTTPTGEAPELHVVPDAPASAGEGGDGVSLRERSRAERVRRRSRSSDDSGGAS